MLPIIIEKSVLFDEENNTFIHIDKTVLELEHSLHSIALWERKWHKPYLSKDAKTTEETMDYIRCMTLNDVDPKVYMVITNEQIAEINAYIENPMTASTFSDVKAKSNSREFITCETIYYWMTVNSIPFECDKWHFNALMALIRMCGIKNNPDKKKMSKREVYAENAKQNARLRAELEALDKESK